MNDIGELLRDLAAKAAQQAKQARNDHREQLATFHDGQESAFMQAAWIVDQEQHQP